MAQYFCSKCGAQAHKDPCVKPATGLKKWHCDRCGVTKVTRRNEKSK